MNKKLLSLILTAVLAISCLVSCSGGDTAESTSADTTAADTTAASTDSATEFVPDADPNLDAVSVKSENFSLSNADMSYLFQNAYQEVIYQLSQSGMTPATVGLNVNASLKKQECSVDKDSETWFDFFLNAAKNEAKQLLALCELAKAEGIELTDEDLAVAEATIADIKEYAEAEGSTLEAYITLMYGQSVDVDTVRHMLSLTALSAKYVEETLSKVDVSDAALEAAYEKYKNNYETVDYVVYGFDYKDLITEEAGEDEIAAAKAAVNGFASELAKCRDKDSFLAYAKNNMITELGLTESEAEDALKQLVSENVKYSESSEVTEWAFNAEIGDIYTEESPGSEGELALYLLTGRHERDDSASLHNVRHILFLSTTYKDDTKAREVYDAWVAGGADVDSFVDLVVEYSEDPGSLSTGGLYEGVYEGQMVDEFNDWVFDPARKHGDHGIVKTSYGWHIMYYEDGFAEWKYDMKQKLTSEAYTEINAKVEKVAGVTFDETLLATISA
ncbi:MAG: peptidylprolyl isomerase [Clostridia bacterium]|nr:peptidylprolyl isomerase [Clostridia bacterium]